MTYEEAIQTAIEELDEVIQDLIRDNWGWENIIDSECGPLIVARNVLRRELEIADVQNALLDVVERAVRKGNANSDIEEAYIEYEVKLEQVNRAIEAKLKEKNT